MIEDVSTGTGPDETGPAAPRIGLALTIIAHPDPNRAGERFVFERPGAGVVSISRNEPEFRKPGSALGAPLGEARVSRKPLRISYSMEGAGLLGLSADAAAKVVVGEPLAGDRQLAPLAHGDVLPIVLGNTVVLALHLLDLDNEAEPAAMGMLGHGAGLRRVRRSLAQIADLDVPVLIRGETGTGKELVARAIHAHGPRGARPFVSINLGALPKELAAAELFGSVKGAFTGSAQSREGFFRAAGAGTLFLDEIGEAPPEVQVMLLRVLETGEMYPVGGHSPVRTEARLVAATDADLERHIREGRFKAPLLHRLAGYEVRLPPLRERREDVGLLYYSFAREELDALGEAHRWRPTASTSDSLLPASLAVRLLNCHWPGNIRQLRNVVRQVIIGSRGKSSIEVDPRLLAELDAGAPVTANVASASRLEEAPVAESVVPRRARRRPSEISEPELIEALRAASWDMQSAAERLGIPRPSIYDRIERSPSLRTAGDLSPGEIERCFVECSGDLGQMASRLEVSRRALGRRVREMGLGGRREVG